MANVVEIVVKAKDDTKGALAGVKAGFQQAFSGLAGLAAAAGADLAASLTGPAVAAVGLLATEFAGAGAALGAFGAAVQPQISGLQEVSAAGDAAEKAIMKFGKGSEQATRAVEYHNKLLGQLPQTTQVVYERMDHLKNVFRAWSDSLAPTTMPIFARGMDLLSSLIPKLTPLVLVAAKALSDFMGTLERGAKGGGVDSFIKTMTKVAADTLPHLLNSVKNIAVGLGALFTAFAPFTSGSMAAGIEKITQKFADWAKSLQGNTGFQQFMEDSKAKMPGVLEMLGNLARIVLSVAEAMAPFTGVTLIVAEALAKLVASIPQETMDWLAPTITGIVLAIKAWTVVQGLLNVLLAANPLGLVVIAVGALAAGLYLAYQRSETFREIVNESFSKVGEVVDGVWNDVIKKALEAMKAFFDGDIKESIDNVATAFEGLGTKAAEAADKILGTNVSMKDTKGGAQDVIDFLKEHWEPVIGGLIGGPLGAAVGLLQDGWGQITKVFSKHTRDLSGKWKRFWNGLVDVLEQIFGTITDTVLRGVRNVGTFLLRPFPGLQARWQRAWKLMVQVVDRMNDAIFRTLRRLPGLVVRAAGGAWNSLVSGVQRAKDKVIGILNSLLGRVSSLGSQIGGALGGALGGLAGFAHGGIVGAAGGGPRSNLTLVGEQGPELVRLPPGSFVHTNGATRRMLSGGGGGGGEQRVVLEFASTGNRLEDLLIELLRHGIRVRGGNVQTVLGAA